MKDEIKEILDKLNKLEYDDYCLEFSVDYIERKEEKLLYDYITNLQESEAYYYGQYKDYKSRCEKAIKMFNNEKLNEYYYGMSYEFEINDFKEDMLNILNGGEDDE